MTVIDSDQHLYEYRGLWEVHIDPSMRDEATRVVDDSLGHVHVMWRDEVLAVGDVQSSWLLRPDIREFSHRVQCLDERRLDRS